MQGAVPSSPRRSSQLLQRALGPATRVVLHPGGEVLAQVRDADRGQLNEVATWAVPVNRTQQCAVTKRHKSSASTARKLLKAAQAAGLCSGELRGHPVRGPLLLPQLHEAAAEQAAGVSVHDSESSGAILQPPLR